jgi:hypothetical protein
MKTPISTVFKHDILLMIITALVVLFAAGLVKPIPDGGTIIIPP